MDMIRQLQINNYKSIGQLNLSCSRINVFVGEPNVGKSNILEALDLSYLPWMLLRNSEVSLKDLEGINLKQFFRVNGISDLFHFGDISKSISINTYGFCPDFSLDFKKKERTSDSKEESLFEIRSGNGSIVELDNDFNTLEKKQYFGSPIHPYKFKDNIEFHDNGNYMDTLMPPFGNNLGRVISHSVGLQDLIKDLAKEYGFNVVIDKATDKISIQLKVNDGLVYSLKYEALADTFRRILFYVTAIRTNNAHVVTLEEPEAHSFPKYVSLMADEIIERRDRQFFIATHSPYLLNNLIENTPEGELSVFVCGYDNQNRQTTAKKLSSDDLSELLDYGVDIFFNINKYLDDRIEYSA
jgi:AAA15 family ATPase/GTPase